MKRIGLLLTCIALVAVLTACAANSAPAPTPMPTTVPTLPPGPGMDGASPGPTDGALTTAAMTGAESSAFSKKANDAAAKISEVDSCVTAIIGDTCVVGVTFDGQYKGELTDRIRDMVSSRIQSAVPTVERVAVTSDPALTAQIGVVADKISSADALSGLTGDLNDVLSKIQ